MKPIAVDTETTGLDHQKSWPFCITTCRVDGKTEYYDLMNGAKHKYYDPETEIPTFHNAIYDLFMLRNAGYDLPIKYNCTMLMAHLVSEYHASISMDYLAKAYNTGEKYSNPEFESWLHNRKNKKLIEETGYLNAPRAALEEYARSDVVHTIKFHYIFMGILERTNYVDYYKFELSYLPYLMKLEDTGIQVDVPYVLGKMNGLISKIGALEADLVMYGINNPRSPKQVKEAFQAHDIYVKSTDADQLAKLTAQGYEIATTLRMYRRMTKVHEKLNSILKYTDKDTQRLHAQFNQTRTKTGRLSSSNPNQQNNSRPDPDDPLTQLERGSFIAKPDHYIIGADYDQQEICIIADETKDPILLKMLKEKDVYVEVAKIIFPGKEITKKLRYIAKQATLGIAYWVGAPRLSQEFSNRGFFISVSKCRDIIHTVGEMFPNVMAFREKMKNDNSMYGYVEDRFGRRYHVPKKLGYKTFNNYVQGTASGMTKRAHMCLQDIIDSSGPHDDCYFIRIINIIHDEVMFEVHNRVSVEEASSFILQGMLSVQQYFNIKLGASIKRYKTRWSEEI